LGFIVDKKMAERNPSLGITSRCPHDDPTRFHVERSDMRRERNDRCGVLRKWKPVHSTRSEGIEAQRTAVTKVDQHLNH
jgi:hypothetical protein